MRSADLIREARLRAGLTQAQLAERSGRERSVIARWEQGAVAPSIESLLELVRVCGFELPLELVPRDDSAVERLRKNLLLSPERRIERILKGQGPSRTATGETPQFDPYALLAALERRRLSYVLVGSFARVIRAAEESPVGLDVVPSLRGANARRLEQALSDLGAPKRGELRIEEARGWEGPVIETVSAAGTVRFVPIPEGTRGYDDLRRAATREHLGRGLRPSAASLGDLARMLAAAGREEDAPRLHALRRIAELERSLGLELGL